MKAKLCKCNNCNSILLDQNPQTGAIQHDLGQYPNIKHMKYVKNENDRFWACPICETDDYLTDL
jgi:hypothetical protein